MELMPKTMASYDRITREEVSTRLEQGDDPTANRVLHLAFRAGQIVGCCSSMLRPPWPTPFENCGHWGLLVPLSSS